MSGLALPGVDPDWIPAVQSWAMRHPEVLAVHAYGSRVTGKHRPDSDLDLGVEVAGEDFSERFCTWRELHGGWHEELQAKLPVVIHLEMAHPEDTSGTVWPAIEEHGQTLYAKLAR